MKIKTYFVFILFLILSVQFFSQSNVGYRQLSSEKTIPKLVVNNYKAQYPDVLTSGWYVTHISYWQNDCSTGWYTGWYGQQTVVVYVFEKPAYFEVEFVDNPGELSRAIYNKNGIWYETRTRIKGLPENIIEDLKKSQYGDWKISSFKERIDSPNWPLAVYRFKVTKGVKSRILRVDVNGEIIQAKYVEE